VFESRGPDSDCGPPAKRRLLSEGLLDPLRLFRWCDIQELIATGLITTKPALPRRIFNAEQCCYFDPLLHYQTDLRRRDDLIRCVLCQESTVKWNKWDKDDSSSHSLPVELVSSKLSQTSSAILRHGAVVFSPERDRFQLRKRSILLPSPAHPGNNLQSRMDSDLVFEGPAMPRKTFDFSGLRKEERGAERKMFQYRLRDCIASI
jgi:hypothetical protein